MRARAVFFACLVTVVFLAPAAAAAYNPAQATSAYASKTYKDTQYFVASYQSHVLRFGVDTRHFAQDHALCPVFPIGGALDETEACAMQTFWDVYNHTTWRALPLADEPYWFSVDLAMRTDAYVRGLTGG